jgi:hypothetical protein
MGQYDGKRISSSGVTASAGFATAPFFNIAALFLDKVVRS